MSHQSCLQCVDRKGLGTKCTCLMKSFLFNSVQKAAVLTCFSDTQSEVITPHQKIYDQNQKRFTLRLIFPPELVRLKGTAYKRYKVPLVLLNKSMAPVVRPRQRLTTGLKRFLPPALTVRLGAKHHALHAPPCDLEYTMFSRQEQIFPIGPYGEIKNTTGESGNLPACLHCWSEVHIGGRRCVQHQGNGSRDNITTTKYLHSMFGL